MSTPPPSTHTKIGHDWILSQWSPLIYTPSTFNQILFAEIELFRSVSRWLNDLVNETKGGGGVKKLKIAIPLSMNLTMVSGVLWWNPNWIFLIPPPPPGSIWLCLCTRVVMACFFEKNAMEHQARTPNQRLIRMNFYKK